MKKKITVNVIIHMVLIILAVICLFPIFLVLINSFKENAEIVRNPLSLPDIIHLENYIQAWTTGKFAKGFLNSVKLTGCTVIIVLICATLAGYVLAGKRIKGSGAVLMYFMVAMTVPIQLFLFPLYYAYAKMNLIGNIPATSVILSATYMPLAIFLMRTFFLNVPRELEEAARIDGANTRQVIWSVMRPVVSPGREAFYSNTWFSFNERKLWLKYVNFNGFSYDSHRTDYCIFLIDSETLCRWDGKWCC